MESRRAFLRATAGAGLLGSLGDLSAFAHLSPLTAAEATVTPEIVRFTPEIEPVVRLIEETPREKCFEAIAQQLSGGLPYRRLLAAIFLAGIRNVNPQPPGFKFHCVFVMHAAHELSLAAPAEDRLLPMFYALDKFKASQQEDVEQGDFELRPVEGSLPSSETAWAEFRAAMDDWDEARADRAIVALVRSQEAREIIEGLWRYGARDYRNIGHKAIYVANAWRTLQTIGWQHSEPTMRSLVLGLLDFGKDERVNNYAFEDQSYLTNVRLSRRVSNSLPADWTEKEPDAGFTKQLLEVMRSGDSLEAARTAGRALVQGKVGAGAAWDAVHLAAGELMMRQPGIYGIHTVTSVNGLQYAFRTSEDRETKVLMLLQAIGWMCQFANFMAGARGGLQEADITAINAAELPDKPEAAADEVLTTITKDARAAAAKAYAYAQKRLDPQVFRAAARRLIFTKANEVHFYKYAASIFEDYDLVSPAWHPHMLATAVYYLCGSGLPDSPVMQRAREAVKGLG